MSWCESVESAINYGSGNTYGYTSVVAADGDGAINYSGEDGGCVGLGSYDASSVSSAYCGDM